MTFRNTLASQLLGKFQILKIFKRDFRNVLKFRKKNYWDLGKKVLELPETCKSAKIIFWP
jgi:hypothetical protein